MPDIAKHTSGPWGIIPCTYTVHRRSVEGFQIYADGNSSIITQLIPGKTTDRTTEICKANAHLIAAAPELLEVAILVHKACGVQANLNSTATEAERSQFIESIFAICNNKAWPAIAKAQSLS